ncbi:MAG: hypothetical protein CMJ18_03045, partial [Phycisphaeraceae bacterium]|nr:hypothetical protein [Phycisphaeraceae bacterium]
MWKRPERIPFNRIARRSKRWSRSCRTLHAPRAPRASAVQAPVFGGHFGTGFETLEPRLLLSGTPDSYDAPDFMQPLQVLDVQGTSITVYASQPSPLPYALTRDPTVFTAGSGSAPYFYPAATTPTAVQLRAETDYYDLPASETVAVEVAGLTPSTAYYYRVEDSAEVHRFRTAPRLDTFEPFQFVVIGDTQGPYDSEGWVNLTKDRLTLGPFDHANQAANAQYNRITDAMRSRGLTPDLVTHVGDIVEDARYWVQWSREFFSDLKYLLTLAPTFSVMGNHEYHDPRFHEYLELAIPATSRQELTERAYYSFDHGNAHFVFLDMNGHWYTIYDIDQVPTETGWSYDIDGQAHYYEIEHVTGRHYTIDNNALALLPGHLTPQKIQQLDPLRNLTMERDELQAELDNLGFSAAESRKVRTAAIHSAHRNMSTGRVEILIQRGDLGDRQIEWLEADLTKHNDKDYIFVYTHHPQLYGSTDAQPYTSIYEEHGVSAVFSGHAHLYAHHLRNGTHYFQTGGGSDETFTALNPSQPSSFIYHRYGPQYMVLDVEADEVTALGIGLDNQVFETTVIPPRQTKFQFDFGSTDSPVADGHIGASPAAYTAARGHGWTSGTRQPRDRSGPDDLRRDFVAAYGGPARFAVNLPNGTYEVTVVMGDEDVARDHLTLRLEPGSANEVSDLVGLLEAGQFHEQSYVVDVADGQLNLQLQVWATINALAIEPVPLSRRVDAAFDFGPSASPVAPGFTGLAAEAYDPITGHGWTSGILTAADRAGPDDLRRDVVLTTDIATFALDLPNGAYEVGVVLGDPDQPSDDMRLRFEPGEAAELTEVVDTLTPGQFHEQTYTVVVHDQQLNLELTDLGGATDSVPLGALTITPEIPPPPVVPRGALGFDFGTGGSPVAEGYIGFGGDPFDAGPGFGWTTGAPGPVHRGTPDDARRDFVTISGAPARFAVDLPDGLYMVTIVMGDEDEVRDQMAIRLEPGEQSEISDIVNRLDAGAYHQRTYPAEVADGRLLVEIEDLGGDTPEAVINAMVITPVDRLAFDFGPTDSEVARWHRGADDAAYEQSRGYGWTAGSVNARAPGGPDDLRRDSVVVTGTSATFAADVPNGYYRVSPLFGDPARVRDRIRLRFEPGEATEATHVLSLCPAGAYCAPDYLVEVRDGQLGMELSDMGGATDEAAILGLTIAPFSDRRFDFGTSGSPVATGHVGAGAGPFDPDLGYGWSVGTPVPVDRSGPDDLRRDLVAALDGPARFDVELPSGMYHVSVVMGDETLVRDQMQLRLEPDEAGEIMDVVDTLPAGAFREQTYAVVVADGRLTLELLDQGGTTPAAVLNGLSIEPGGPLPSNEHFERYDTTIGGQWTGDGVWEWDSGPWDIVRFTGIDGDPNNQALAGTADVDLASIELPVPNVRTLSFDVYGLSSGHPTQGIYVIPLGNSGGEIAQIVVGQDGISMESLPSGTWHSLGPTPLGHWHHVDFELRASDNQMRARANDGPWTSWLPNRGGASDGQGIARIDLLRYNGTGYWDNFTFVDAPPPPPPVTPAPDLIETAGGGGASLFDDIVRDPTTGFAGVVEPGSDWSLYFDGQLARSGSTVDGTWSTTGGMAEGLHEITAQTVDATGRMWLRSRPLTILVDLTPPVSRHSIEGSTVTLDATDTGGSGVHRIQYRIDSGPWTTYTDPFEVTGLPVEYFAGDVAGNDEEPRIVTLPGDLDGDYVVGAGDLQIVLSHFTQQVPVGDPLMGDMTGPGGVPDGLVGTADLQMILSNFTRSILPPT